MIPSPAATESTQASTETGTLLVTPMVFSAQPCPASTSQIRTRFSPMAATTISRSAMPADFISTVRNGGENICASALAAASIMGVPLAAI